jgi:hypothetical protein
MEILQDLNVSLRPDQVPAGAAAPMRWETFSYWLREQGDEGRRFIEHIDILSPDQKPLVSESQAFTMDNVGQRNVATFVAFPLVGPGTYNVVLSIREESEERGREVASYPLNIFYRPD